MIRLFGDKPPSQGISDCRWWMQHSIPLVLRQPQRLQLGVSSALRQLTLRRNVYNRATLTWDYSRSGWGLWKWQSWPWQQRSVTLEDAKAGRQADRHGSHQWSLAGSGTGAAEHTWDVATALYVVHVGRATQPIPALCKAHSQVKHCSTVHLSEGWLPHPREYWGPTSSCWSNRAWDRTYQSGE